MKTLEFPLERAGVTRSESDLGRLTRLLRESAFLLEASRESSDSEFRLGSVDLAIRAMRAASMALDRKQSSDQARQSRAAVLPGPWEGSTVLAPDGV